MKTFKMILALILAVGMMACCASAETAATPAEPVEEATASDAKDENPVIARLGDFEVRLMDVQSFAGEMYSEGLITSPADYAAALDYLLIYNALPKAMVKDIGLENLLSEEKIQELYEQADAAFKAEIDTFIAYYYGSDLSDEDYRTIYDMVSGAYAEEGFSMEEYRNNFVIGEAFAEHFNTFTFEVSEEEIMETFESFVESDREMFEGNILMYEYATNYYGYIPYYMPSGYRGVTHILIDADADALAAYAEVSGGDDAEAIEKAKNAVIESCRDKLDEIYARIEAGESFEALIGEYNTDPGMAGDTLKNGYAVHKDAAGVTFMKEFVDGAFTEKMAEAGDVSDPVVTSYGVHILYYLRDIPSGAIEYTDDVRAEVEKYLIAKKQDALLRSWLNDYGVEYTAAYADMMG